MTIRQNIPGTSRQSQRTKTGITVERGYVYLPPAVWSRLYELASYSGMNSSTYIENLVLTADKGRSEKGNNDSNAHA
jgi:hypothetical protein